MASRFTTNAPVAQLDRVPGYEPGGREFESLRARHFAPDKMVLISGKMVRDLSLGCALTSSLRSLDARMQIVNKHWRLRVRAVRVTIWSDFRLG